MTTRAQALQNDLLAALDAGVRRLDLAADRLI